MTYDFKQLKAGFASADAWLRRELSGIRTGRATPAIFDAVLVESYGAKMPVVQLASVNLEDPRTLRITPYDASQTKNIEKGIVQANLGLSVVVDDRGLRVVFPELTAERRAAYLKLAREKVEEAKKKIRSARDETWKDIQTKEREKKMGEDEKFRLKETMEKLSHEATAGLEALLVKKEKELSS